MARSGNAETFRQTLEILQGERKPEQHLYEQTFFTDRAPGDESHLLKWYEAVTKENMERIRAQLLKEGVENAWLADDAENDFRGYKAEEVYANLARTLGSAKAASEFLYRAGIDGVKYPVDSYGGKGVKDGDEAGWNYVAFSDEHIRVDHKWTDGEQRFSVTVNPEVRAAVTVDAKDATLGKTKAALAALAGKPLVNDETKIEAWINDVQARKIVSNKAVAKSEANGFTKAEHNAAAAIIDTLWKYASLGKSDADKDGDPNIRSVKRFVAPVFFRTGDGAKSAYAYITAKESVEHGHRIYSIEIEKLEALGKRLDLNQALLPNAPSAAYDTKSAPARQAPAATPDAKDATLGKTKIADAVLSVRLRSEEPLLTSDYEASAKETVRLGDIVLLGILPQSAPARQEGAADAQRFSVSPADTGSARPMPRTAPLLHLLSSPLPTPNSSLPTPNS